MKKTWMLLAIVYDQEGKKLCHKDHVARGG